MSYPHNLPARWAALREERRAQRVQRDAREALAQQLSAFQSRRDLIDLSALLARYDDAKTEGIRGVIDWSSAA